MEIRDRKPGESWDDYREWVDAHLRSWQKWDDLRAESAARQPKLDHGQAMMAVAEVFYLGIEDPDLRLAAEIDDAQVRASDGRSRLGDRRAFAMEGDEDFLRLAGEAA